MRGYPLFVVRVIVSTTNPTVKSLRQLHQRRGREQQGRYLVEGVRLVEEALQAGIAPSLLLVAPELLRATARGRALHERLLHEAGRPAPLEVTPGVLRHVAETTTPSGVVAALPLPVACDLAALPSRAGLAVVLDGVQDPGNAGTILRSAAAAGVDAVVALAGCVDLFAPKVVRAAMGAHFHLALATEVEISWLHGWAATRGQFWVADARAGVSLYEADLRAPCVVVVGGEAHGALHGATLPAARGVAIPMPGRAESLNVAVAAAIVLFEALRQRRSPPGAPASAPR